MLLALALRNLRHRRSAFAGAFVALFCAAALVTGCGMIMETGLTGSMAPQRYAGVPVVVSGDQNVHWYKSKGKLKSKPHADRAWIPASITDRLQAVPGVTSVVPEVSFPAFVAGHASDGSWGHGWESASLTPFTLRAGHAPVGTDEVVVDPSVRVPLEAVVPIQTPAGVASYRVVGVTAQALPGQSAIFFSTTQARRLSGHPGMVSAIGVFPAVSRASVQAAVAGTGAVVHMGDGRGAAEFTDAGSAQTRLISMGASMGGTALLVGVLAVVGAFGLAIQQRERELAVLRAIAATPRQIRKMITREMVVIGLAAAPPGAVVGLGVGAWFHSRLVDLGAVPAGLHLVVGPFAPLVAVLATVVAGMLAARISARRITRIKPVEALGDAARPSARLPVLRLVAGVAAIAGGVVLTVLLSTLSSDAASGPVTPLTALVWCIAIALLGPLLAGVAFRVLGLGLRVNRATGELAAATLRSGARRLAPVITSLSLLVSMACTMAFAQTTMRHAGQSQASAGNLADYQVGPHVPAQATASLRRVAGVQAVTEVLHTTVRTHASAHSTQGVTVSGLAKNLDLGVSAGSLDRLGPTTLAVAERLGYKVGDSVSMTLGDGTPVTLQVVAVYRRGLGFGDFTMDRDLVAAHVDVPFADRVLVSAPGVDRSALVGALRGFPGVQVLDRTAAAAAAKRSDHSTAAAYIGLTLIAAFAAISAVNTLVMFVLGRGREFALLRLAGATRRQVRRMLTWETLCLLLVALGFGTAIAVSTLVAYATGMTGSSSPYVPVLGYLGIVGGAALLAVLATFLPARAALRRAPAAVLAVRE